MKLKNTRALAFGLAFAASAIAGCGGTGINSPSGSAVNPLPVGTTGKTVARVTITIPPKTTTSARKPSYVSAATQSIRVSVDSSAASVQNLTPGSANCNVPAPLSPLTCTVDIAASPGTHTFTFTTYDQTNAGGNQLSVNSATQNLIAGQLNLVNVTLAGIPKSIAVVPAPGALISGNQTAGLTYIFGTKQTVLVTTLDADGNYIIGPGSPALQVSASTGPANFSVAPAGVNNPNAFSLNATTSGTGTLAITATPASTLAGTPITANVPVTSTVLVSVLDGNGPGNVDGPASTAKLEGNGWASGGMTYDATDGNLYFGDTDCSVRQVVPSGATAGTITSIAGAAAGYFKCYSSEMDGVGATASGPPNISALYGVVYDADDHNLYNLDYMHQVIEQVNPSTGAVMTVAGRADQSQCFFADGTGSSACFDQLIVGAYDTQGHNLYVVDQSNCAIRRVNVSSGVTNGGVVTTIAGSAPPTPHCGFADGTGSAAQISNALWGMTYDSADGNLYLTDTGNCAIRQISTSGVVKTLAGGTCDGTAKDGTGSAATFNKPYGIAYDSVDRNLYVGDLDPAASMPSSLRQVTPAGVVTTVMTSGLGKSGYGTQVELNSPAGLTFDPANGMLYVFDYYTIKQVQL